MAMDHKAGIELQTGVTPSGVSGVHEQSATMSAKGELKVFKDREGNDISVYATDKHNEYSFEALLESDVEDHEVGDGPFTIGGVSGYITQWDVVEKNDDAKLVRGGIRTFLDID